MTKKEIIKDLEENIYCRVQRSSIHGVGIVAIKDIPKGINPLDTKRIVKTVAIPEAEIMNNKKIPAAVKKMVASFYAKQDGYFYSPAYSLNQLDISYFLNHSKTPNMIAKEVRGEMIFIAKRKIRAGAELTSDYDTYSE
jgi:SET domain-containing protein